MKPLNDLLYEVRRKMSELNRLNAIKFNTRKKVRKHLLIVFLVIACCIIQNTEIATNKKYLYMQIRLVIEESLNQLPFSKCTVTTPTGAKYKGLKYQKGNCGVSIVRSGEAMEQVYIFQGMKC